MSRSMLKARFHKDSYSLAPRTRRDLSRKYFNTIQKYYAALNVDTTEKKAQETFSLHHTGDFFKKIVILDGNQKIGVDEDGVIYVGVIPFLLDVDILM